MCQSMDCQILWRIRGIIWKVSKDCKRQHISVETNLTKKNIEILNQSHVPLNDKGR